MTNAEERELFTARAAVREPKKLQYVADKQQYRISVGKHVNKNGRTAERVFWLGKDELYARCLALALKRTWAGIVVLAKQAEVAPLWVDAELAGASDEADDEYTARTGRTLTKGDLPASPSWAPVLADPDDGDKPVAKTKLVTLRDAVDAYNEFLKTAGLADSNRTRQGESFAHLLKIVDPATRLDALTYSKLAEITDKYRKRPLTNKGTPMAVLTVKTVLQHLRQLLTWLEDDERWVGPRRWERSLRFKASEEMTSQERRARGNAVQVFTPEEIGILWQTCRTPVEQSVLLFGLNFAATQTQIAALRKTDHQGDHLHLYRSKTSVEVFYDYWPETQELMGHWVRTTPETPEGFLMVTATGRPLVHFSEAGGKTDTVDDAWRRILYRSELPPGRRLTFSALRDTTSNAILDRAGLAVQQQVLAQAPTTVAQRHYTDKVVRSDFDDMNRHMREWYEQTVKPQLGEQKKVA